MAWNWSHTAEAYANARENLDLLNRGTLCVIFAEWEACKSRNGEFNISSISFSSGKYQRALKKADTLPDDILADAIWERAEAAATCDNGGHAAWLCPFGCASHCVPFDSQGDSGEDGDGLEDQE